MTNHVTKVKRSGEGVIGTCSCKMKQPKAVKTKQEAEDWIVWHEAQVRRARVGNEPVPGLERTRQMYLDNAANELLPQRERDQWQALADEISQRLGYNAPPSEQLALFGAHERRTT